MAVTAKMYGGGIQSMLNKEIDWDTDPIKGLLTTVAYVPNQAHRYLTDVVNPVGTAPEISGTGYTAGGLALTGTAVTYSAGPPVTVKLYCDHLVWNNATVSGVRILVVYADVGSKPLVSYMDLGADQSATAKPFIITAPSGGLVSFTP